MTMRLACALLLAGLQFGGILGTVSAALMAVTDLTASANGWDQRTSGNGCVPNSCYAGLAIDGSIDEQSRWSCQAGVSLVDPCELTLTLGEPADLVEVRVSLLKGDQRIRSMNIFVDGALVTTITSSGTTEGFETYELTTIQASTVVIQAAEPVPDNGWLSIIELDLMVESDSMLEETPASVTTDETYVGCFVDTLDDRIMSIVATTDELTPESCAANCTGMGNDYFYYALQQGNECWCSGCDLTGNGTNTAYDRHGVGVCTAACAGDTSMACGGDMVFSLYQTGTCATTLAPTTPLLEIPGNGCPNDSIPSSLEISLLWLEDADLDLHVIEPGGKEVYFSERRGDVGIMSNDNFDGPGSEIFTLQNGLNVEEDKVLGTYAAFVTNGEPGTPWVMTARLTGDLNWSVSGFIPESSSSDDPINYTVDVAEYTESTCDMDIYGTCPSGTFSNDGTPPCTACDAGEWSNEGSASCFIAALMYVDAPPELLSAMEEDATGGFAGPGSVVLDGGGSIWTQITLDENDGGELEIVGTFQRDDDTNTSLPSSTSLFVYLELEDGSFMRGRGMIAPSTGEFSASMSGIPDGFSKIFYSFVVLDPEESFEIDDPYGSSVFDAEVISFSCPSPLTITLEWSTVGTDFDMQVTEPDGSSYFPWEIGAYGFGSGDVTDGYGPEIWTVYPGYPEAIGTYTVRLFFQFVEQITEWTLTARVNGAIAWVETGVYDPHGGGYSYFYRGDSREDGPFYVTLASVETDGC